MLIDTNTAPAKLVTFGAGGDSVHFTRGCYSQGYGTPERPHAADPANNNIPDGTPVVDMRDAVKTPDGYAWAFKGPLVDVDLPDGECSPLSLGPNEQHIASAAATANGSFAFLIALQLVAQNRANKTRGPLDSVSIAEFALGWKERGARVGHYEAGKIVWHD